MVEIVWEGLMYSGSMGYSVDVPVIKSRCIPDPRVVWEPEVGTTKWTNFMIQCTLKTNQLKVTRSRSTCKRNF